MKTFLIAKFANETTRILNVQFVILNALQVFAIIFIISLSPLSAYQNSKLCKTYSQFLENKKKTLKLSFFIVPNEVTLKPKENI